MAEKYQLDRAYGCCANEENISPALFVTKNEILDSSGNPEVQVNLATGWICDKCGFVNTQDYALKYITADEKLVNLLKFNYTDWMVKYLKQALVDSNIKHIIFNKIEPTDYFLKIVQELNLTVIPASDHNSEKVS